jgi:hypothetical protein
MNIVSHYSDINSKPKHSDIVQKTAIALVSLVLIALAALPLLDGGRGQLLAVTTGALAIAGLIFLALGALAPALLLPRLITISYMLQLVWLLAITICQLPTIAPYNRRAPDISAEPIMAVMPLLIVPLGVLSVVLLSWMFKSGAGAIRPLSSILEDASQELGIYLFFAALLMLLYWPASLADSGLLGYLIRVFAHTLVLMPLIAGNQAIRLPMVNRFWIVAMAINAFIGLMVGSRGVALMPPCLYAIGFILSLPAPRRGRIAVTMALAAIPVFIISGVIGVVRDQIGRGGLEILSSDRISQVFYAVTDSFTNPSGENATLNGLRRMVIWSNLVVPVMSPAMVDYRGFENLGNELALSAQIASVSGLSRDELYQAGLASAPANDYGFNVNSGNSVEFGILADGWSRGGPAMALLFAILVATILIGFESLLRNWGGIDAAVLVLFYAVLVKSGIDVCSLPLLSLLRALTLNIGLIMIVVGLVYLVKPRQLKQEVRT